MKLRSRIVRYLKLKFFFHLFLSFSYFSIFAINFAGFAYAEDIITETQPEFSWEETDTGVKSNISISDNETYTFESIDVKFANLPSENLKLAVSKIDKSELPDNTQAESDAYDIKLLDENNNEITTGFNIEVTFHNLENTNDELSVISFQNIDEISEANVEESNLDDGKITATADHLTIFLVVKVVDHTSGSSDYIYSDVVTDTPNAGLPATLDTKENNTSNSSTYIKSRGHWPLVATNIGNDYIDFYFGDISTAEAVSAISFISNFRIQPNNGSAGISGNVDTNNYNAKLYAKDTSGSYLDLNIDKKDLVPNLSTGQSQFSSNYEEITTAIDSGFFNQLNLTDFVIRYTVAGEHTANHPGVTGLATYIDSVGLDVSYVPADTTAPEVPTGVTIIQNTVDIGCNAYTTTRPIKIDWTDNAEADFDHYIYENLSGSFTTNLTDSEFSGDIANLDGLYGYRVKAVDSGGNESNWTDYCYITLDRVSPVMSNIKMLVNGTETYTPKVGELVTISATVTDTLSTVDKVQIWVRAYPYTGEQITSGNMTNTVSDTWEFTFTMPENYQSTNPISEDLLANYFNFRPWDKAGNSTIGNTTKFTFVNPPDIPELVSPVSGAIIKGADAILDWTDETDLNGPVTYNYKSSWLPSGNFGPVSTGITSQINATASADNTYLWQVQSCDSFNNCSDWTTPFEITIDNTAPVATITSPLTNTLSGTVEVRGTVTDINPHRYYTVVRNSSNATVAGPGTVNNSSSFTDSLLFNWDTTLVPDGQYTIRLEARDLAGNKDTLSTDIITVTVDNTAPTVNLVFPTPSASATSFEAVFNEDVNQIEAGDPANYFLNNWPGAGGSGDLIGDATIVYNPSNFTATVTFTNAGWYISPEQQWGVENIHDLAGNLLIINPYTAYSTPLVAPVTSTSGIDENWHNTDITVTLICADTNGSGCKTTYYTTDGTNPNLTSSVGNSFTLSTEGEFTIKYFSTDNAGNTETINTAVNTVKIDKTNPSGTVVINSDETYTNNKTVTLEMTSTDNLSGVSEMAFSNDRISYSTPETFSVTKTWDLTDTDETKTVYIKLTDQAGNEFTTSDSIILDTTIPVSTVTLPSNAGSHTTTYINNWDGIISGTSSDNFEVANVQLSINRASDGFYFNGTSWVTSASEILLNTTTSDLYSTWSYSLNPAPTGDETYTILSHATDGAGNFENSYKLTLIYDVSIPQIELTIDPTQPNGDNDIYISEPKVTLTAGDNYDIDYIEYQINAKTGTWTKYTDEVTIKEGATEFYYRSVDKAGNTSKVGLKNISVDTTPPNALENVDASFHSEISEVSIYWDNNDTDIYNVKIYKSTSSNVQQNLSNFFIAVAKNITEITDDNIDRGTTYYYLLVSYDEAGNEGDSVKIKMEIPEDATEKITTTTETPSILSPNIVNAEENGQVKGTNTDEGEILGEDDVNIDLGDIKNNSGFIDFLIKYWWLFLLIPFIFWILWWVYKRNKKDK